MVQVHRRFANWIEALRRAVHDVSEKRLVRWAVMLTFYSIMGISVLGLVLVIISYFVSDDEVELFLPFATLPE